MDPTALAALLEAQERRHQESLTAMMERMHGLFLEANRGREPAVQPAVPLPRVRVVKMSLEDDPEAYLVAFERQATAAQWPREWWATQLGPNLIGEAQAAYQALTHEQALVYDQVKQAILQRLDITEETHRRRFREYQRPPGLRPRVVAQQLVDHVTRWLCPGTNDAEKITELIAIEQFVKVLGPDTQNWVTRHRPTTLEAAVRLAEGYEDALASAPVVVTPAPPSNRPRTGPTPRTGPPQHFTPSPHGATSHRHPTGGLPPPQWRARSTPSGVRAENPSPLPNRQRDTQAPWAPFHPTCYRCHEVGHLARNCPAAMECGAASHYLPTAPEEE
ncbi:zinc finger and SCAN domain-containing protein 29-like [Acipenser ruthenus]|uniref:zinc finger and SCAN domain-containing protein 29-like n=1 Tax=Acipenser ruthenus TaxID=7906 RepID=UPI00274067DD|nr:zinc finger and SCAN domain-containing protein 29-like [Acipenser ruthenus]XP_058862736.1 zinc finger and SCAN domain-containing protein 29-like [Acipenser ruthenus]XP_058863663.1 zinc finger and SCAN domain-containing protein 29-like [Acipenser ruthenus]XP_058878913.1 zinc finger and SCAN domain-containing protein 29-like [Acipenser ruthenus]XP_058883729.1 zinc finger and SCAN domain-containing protein 29-like [Acipenser ruthenus]XP_058887543.1 zinc finger and SCAN domain-containing protei